jgi:hypothetical protein
MLQFVVPVNLRTLARVAGLFVANGVAVVVMYLAFGFLGALVLLVLTFLLGRLLLNAALGR